MQPSAIMSAYDCPKAACPGGSGAPGCSPAVPAPPCCGPVHISISAGLAQSLNSTVPRTEGCAPSDWRCDSKQPSRPVAGCHAASFSC
jgi:hypothetical protein